MGKELRDRMATAPLGSCCLLISKIAKQCIFLLLPDLMDCTVPLMIDVSIGKG